MFNQKKKWKTMMSIKLKFRPSVVDEKEGSLYYQVICNRVVRQVATRYKIYREEWDEELGDIAELVENERVDYIGTVRRLVRFDMKRLYNVAELMSEDVNGVSADAVVSDFRRNLSSVTLFGYMESVAMRYWELGQYRTSETYRSTLNSFRRFRGGVDVGLQGVDSMLMEAYESYLRQKGLSPNTISFYIKHIRAVYNRAVDDELVADRRPFKRVFTSTEKTSKRAISLKVIRRLKELDCGCCRSKRFARDMFLFSFYTRGMSFVDIAYLEKKNLKGNVLCYRRKKTNQLLVIQWERCMQEILDEYQSEDSSPYLFSIIRDPYGNTRKQYQNALCLVNRHLKDIGRSVGLHQSLTMYCARHSWASIAREEGIPLSVISEGMGHESERTTQIYLASLKTEIIDKANRRILRLL